MENHRLERVTEALREELGELITFELEDPRLDGVTVTDVHVSPDLKLASVRLAIPGDSVAQRNAVAAMQGAKSFLKKNLAERLDLFRIPELRFEADLSPGANAKLKHLLRRVRKGRPRDTESQEKSAESS